MPTTLYPLLSENQITGKNNDNEKENLVKLNNLETANVILTCPCEDEEN